ncbi:MAG: hypothetical protein JO266_00185 [Acidobacteria bacterium]|nr:hypothetical protein [Acidobacteriota bacterium]
MHKRALTKRKNTLALKQSGGHSPQSDTPAPEPFRLGTMVLATLREPREKVWGALLALNAAGLTLEGIELSSFDDATARVLEGEPLPAAVLFFPMWRVERVAMDLPEGSLPSLSDRFHSRTRREPSEFLAKVANYKDRGRAGA